MGGIDVRKTQAAVTATEAHHHRLENISPLQEVQTDSRRYEDWHLSTIRTTDRNEKISQKTILKSKLKDGDKGRYRSVQSPITLSS